MPHAGYRLVKGTLQSRGFRVQWERVRDSMHRVDIVGILFRMNQLGCVVRRTYSVPGPKSLMHIDTNHKLIRVWEIRERPTEPVSREEQEEHIDVRDHDYCSTPEPASLDMSSQATEDNSKTVEDLQKQLQELRVQREFCLQRFAGSDDNIRFYTRFPSYNHMMAFWFLIEPSIYKMVRVTRAISAAKRNEEVVTHARPSTRQLLQPIDEFFLFLCFLSVGLKERDLANRFNVHQSTVSRIIATWTSFLTTLLGSECIWLTPAEVQVHLPEAFKDFPDTQVILDCTELRCQTPSSLLLQKHMIEGLPPKNNDG
ncbi:uncharacterized protein LOC117541447 [Gymnodraco acuticeps]|uniref:Uncharacterized protein LOC117541447 n=1 Tax=Gymnodraco acuticeps TaxID=8218 RepID=A0A6P8TK84_GYMAC|nr:uncharacterized protein LOC117541447 [Gymnodraco acuticeps]